jgi:hypothetical protein
MEDERLEKASPHDWLFSRRSNVLQAIESMGQGELRRP